MEVMSACAIMKPANLTTALILYLDSYKIRFYGSGLESHYPLEAVQTRCKPVFHRHQLPQTSKGSEITYSKQACNFNGCKEEGTCTDVLARVQSK